MALTLLRRVGTEPIMSMVRAGSSSKTMVKVGSSADFASAMTRMILKNIHLALLARRNEIIELNATENDYAPEQRDEAEPVMQNVRVAVKPGMAKKSINHWDDSVAFDISSNPNSKFKGLSSRRRSKKPAFEFKEIPYDE